MVGGVGYRRDDGSLVIQNSNVFAALDSLRKKKKSDKDMSSKSSGKDSQLQQQQQQVFWTPAPLKAKLWADVDDDEDDDYYPTNAPPSSVWESDEDILDEGDEGIVEEHENELDVVQSEPVAKISVEPACVSVVGMEADRQLSKKEKKKRELAELEALLADFGVAPKESNGQDESREALQENRDGELDREAEKKDNALEESKTAKKKKKEKKLSKEAKDTEDQANNTETRNSTVETEQTREDISSVDMKERLKKMASVKKKKPGKEVDSAARATALEAAARNARLAATKKKEKSHYNQQPVR